MPSNTSPPGELTFRWILLTLPAAFKSCAKACEDVPPNMSSPITSYRQISSAPPALAVMVHGVFIGSLLLGMHLHVLHRDVAAGQQETSIDAEKSLVRD